MTLDLGIKALNLFAPVPSSGTLSLAAPAGHGALVLLLEVIHRSRGRLVALGAASRTRDPREFDSMFNDSVDDDRRETSLLDGDASAEARWAEVERALERAAEVHTQTGDQVFCVLDVEGLTGVPPRPLYAGEGVLVVLFEALLTREEEDESWHALADTTWRFSSEMARAGSYPALDPARSHARGDHAQDAARARWSEGGAWARLLEMYLTQPFEVAEYFTGLPGNHVPAETARSDLEALMRGDADHLEPEALRFKGPLSDAV